MNERVRILSEEAAKLSPEERINLTAGMRSAS